MDKRQTNVNASIPIGTCRKQLSDMFMCVRGRDKEKVPKYRRVYCERRFSESVVILRGKCFIGQRYNAIAV